MWKKNATYGKLKMNYKLGGLLTVGLWAWSHAFAIYPALKSSINPWVKIKIMGHQFCLGVGLMFLGGGPTWLIEAPVISRMYHWILCCKSFSEGNWRVVWNWWIPFLLHVLVIHSTRATSRYLKLEKDPHQIMHLWILHLTLNTEYKTLFFIYIFFWQTGFAQSQCEQFIEFSLFFS